MVEHVLIRLAELKDEAAEEEWEAAHPQLARWHKRLRWLRIKVCAAAMLHLLSLDCRISLLHLRNRQ